MATAPGWPTTSRSTTSPSSSRQRSTRTPAMPPCHTSSTPMRSNAIDLPCEGLAACERSPEEQLVRFDRAGHGADGQPGGSIALDIDGELHALVVPAGGLRALGKWHQHWPEQQLEHLRAVVREAAVALPRVRLGHPRYEQRAAAQRERGVRVVERRKPAVTELRGRPDDAGPRTDDRAVPALREPGPQGARDRDRLLLASERRARCDVRGDQLALAQRAHDVRERAGQRAADALHVAEAQA